MKKSASKKAKERDVVLKAGSPASQKRITHYWHIYHNQKRVGRVYMSQHPLTMQKSDGAFITIELNQRERGKGIGTIVFAKASELSPYDTVYAEMRKGNIASKIAATRAGFLIDKSYIGSQMRLVWQR